MFRVKLPVILLVYAALVCGVIIVSTVLFSIRTQKSIVRGVHAVSQVTLMRVEELVLGSLRSGELSTTQLSHSMIATNKTAKYANSEEEYLQVLGMLAPPRERSSFVYRDEVWIDDDGTLHIVGCSMDDCYAYFPDNDSTMYVPWVQPKELFVLRDVAKIVEGAPSMARQHRDIMSVPFLQDHGQWAPVLIRNSAHDTGTQCNGTSVEYLMTYYSCLQGGDGANGLGNFGAEDSASSFNGEVMPPTHAGVKRFCKHAVASVVELRYINTLHSMGLSMDSYVTFAPLSVDDETNGACEAPLAVRETIDKLVAENADCREGRACSVRTTVTLEHNVSATSVYRNSNGIFFAVNDQTPKSFLFGEMERGRTINMLMNSLMILLMLLVSLAVWYFIAVPLQHICKCMKNASDVGGDAPRVAKRAEKIRSRAIVAEVYDLCTSYAGLCSALQELKAFAPQGLVMHCPSTQGEEDEDSLSDSGTSQPQLPSILQSRELDQQDDIVSGQLDAADVTLGGIHQSSSIPHGATSASYGTNEVSQSVEVCMAPMTHDPGSFSSGDAPDPRRYAYVGLPALTQSTSFRAVSCSLLLIRFQYPAANKQVLERDVQLFFNWSLEAILVHGGVVEMFRPDRLIASFGAHGTDSQHSRNAIRCALQLQRRFEESYWKRTLVTVDAGRYYVGTCGALGRYARTLFGDRFNFDMELNRYNVGLGKIFVTDRIALACTKECIVPVDNIIPSDSTMGPAVQLFHLLDHRTIKPEVRMAMHKFKAAFTNAVRGDYAGALQHIQDSTAYDHDIVSSFHRALLTLNRTTPRRPRYCRHQLPEFEPLGDSTSTAHHHSSLHFKAGIKSLAEQQLQAEAVPHIDFIGAFDDEDDSSESRTGQSQVVLVDDANDLPTVLRDSRGEMWHRISDPIGSGSFAQVYRAISSSGSVIALKCIELSAHNVQLSDVVSEVNMSCKLYHENVVNYSDWTHVGSYLVIMMEFVAGGTLSQIISAFSDGLHESAAKHYASDALKGLSYLHRNGIVHADFKPQNILLTVDGGCKISDFGSSVTKKNTRLSQKDVFHLRGTPPYMSPEVASGETPSMKSDVWAFGITLYQMLSGRLPWSWRHGGAAVEAEGQTTNNNNINNTVSELRHSATAPPQPQRNTTSDPLKLPPSRFIQEVANGRVIPVIDAARLKSSAAIELITACLSENPEDRPKVEEILLHRFFH